ncbi:hypothetical protein [Oceanobacter kriegii]|uniref:hypothetical protein n=1 Tax=Oceanobacter kriegii TaxID=64972 RepID=UPI000411E42D|nr:hypothetical protein [Oceanobacter kriegii]
MNIGSTSGSVMTNGYSQASQAFGQADNKLTVAAQQVADSTTQRPVDETSSISEAVVDMQEGKQLVGAAGKLIEAQNTQLGSLLDTQA